MKPTGFGYEGDPKSSEVSKKGKVAPPTYEGMHEEGGYHSDRLTKRDELYGCNVTPTSAMHGCAHPMQASHPVLSEVQPHAGTLEGSSQPKGARPKTQKPWRQRRGMHR